MDYYPLKAAKIRFQHQIYNEITLFKFILLVTPVENNTCIYSTVTLLAKFRGLSTSKPLAIPT